MILQSGQKRVLPRFLGLWLLLTSPAVLADRFWPDNLFAVAFPTNEHGFIAGEAGTVLRTENGGLSWQHTYVGSNELVRRVSFVDHLHGWAVGHRGTVFHTDDGGISWRRQFQLEGIYLRDVAFVDTEHGWVVGHEGSIWRTEDGGRTWREQRLNAYTGRDVPRLNGIHAIDRNRAIVVGEFGLVAHTENSGELWALTPHDVMATWTAVDGTADEYVLVGLDGKAAVLSTASAAQRAAMDEQRREFMKKKEAVARKKARRRKLEYVPVQDDYIRPVLEYHLEPVSLNTLQSLFDVSVHGSVAIVVGRSTMLQLNLKDRRVSVFDPGEQLEMDFVWFGGTAISPRGEVWASGIRGLVASSQLGGQELRVLSPLAPGSETERVGARRWNTTW